MELVGVRVFTKTKKNNRGAVRQTAYDPAIDAVASDSSKHDKPSLPDNDLGPCVFAKTALKNLLAAGYTFTDEQMERFGSALDSKPITTRNLPLFWILKDGETRASCDKNVRSRYWKDEFKSGCYRFLMYSQWYSDPRKGATKEHFIEWYMAL